MTILFAALFVGAGLSCVVYGIAERSRGRRESLKRLLEAELGEPSANPERLTELMERAGHFADRALSTTSLMTKIQVMLSQAGWHLRGGEFAAVLAAVTVGIGLVVRLLTGSMLVTVAAVLAVPLGAISLIDARGRRRKRMIEEQLPSILQLLAGSLESGSSVLHALELAAEEGEEPLAGELVRVIGETKVGRPLIESLEAMAERLGSRDLDWTVEAIRIQTQTGGKLADTLRVLADFMRARVEVRGEVRALSAEARLSAKILTGLPFLMAGYLFLFRRAYLEPLYTTSLGRMMLVVAFGGIVLGSFWMRRIVRVEV